MALKLPDSAVPMGDFPVAKAVDIDFDDGENLQEKLDNGALGGEGNTTDLTDLENRVTTNETNITDLQEQTSDLQEQIDNLDIPEDVDLTGINTKLSQLETKRVYNSLEELNTAKGLSISFTNGEDNTMKIVDALSPIETFTDYFDNSTNANRFGIDTNTYGTDISILSITKFNSNIVKIRAYLSNGIQLVRTYQNGVLRDWSYDKTDLTEVNTKLTQLETKANLIPIAADNPTNSYDLNNYKENGNYGIGDSSKYSNTPISRPGLLTVIRSNSYRLQIYTVVNNDDVYFRKSTNWGSTWSSWVLLNGEVDLTSINSKLTQLENTINEVGGGGIYQSGEIEVGTWTGGQKLYRYTISDNTERTFSSGTMMLDFFTLSRDEHVVVKLDGTFRMCATTDNSGAHTVYALPYVDLDTNRQVHLVYTTQDRVRLSGKNLKDYKILGFDVSIYYYKK